MISLCKRGRHAVRAGFPAQYRCPAVPQQPVARRYPPATAAVGRGGHAVEAVPDTPVRAARSRRNAANLVVLSGAAAGRAWNGPVLMVEVLRGALAEVAE